MDFCKRAKTRVTAAFPIELFCRSASKRRAGIVFIIPAVVFIASSLRRNPFIGISSRIPGFHRKTLFDFKQVNKSDLGAS